MVLAVSGGKHLLKFNCLELCLSGNFRSSVVFAKFVIAYVNMLFGTF